MGGGVQPELLTGATGEHDLGEPGASLVHLVEQASWLAVEEPAAATEDPANPTSIALPGGFVTSAVKYIIGVTIKPPRPTRC